MQILNKDEFMLQKEKLINEIIKGKVFIYPTDTIYGIGCNAEINNSVKKIRKLKARPDNPFSVIAPSKEWILDNCLINKKELSRLPGPYTLILNLKTISVSDNVNSGLKSLGVRIPNNWFTEIIKEANVPFVTTSVNKAGEQYMTSLEDLNQNIKEHVDYIVYEGPKNGKPSKILDFTKYNVEVKER